MLEEIENHTRFQALQEFIVYPDIRAFFAVPTA